MAYQMVAMAVALNDLEGHSPVADVSACNPSTQFNFGTKWHIKNANIKSVSVRFRAINLILGSADETK